MCCNPSRKLFQSIKKYVLVHQTICFSPSNTSVPVHQQICSSPSTKCFGPSANMFQSIKKPSETLASPYRHRNGIFHKMTFWRKTPKHISVKQNKLQPMKRYVSVHSTICFIPFNNVMLVYDDRLWWSSMMIVYDDRLWWSSMMIMHDHHHAWSSSSMIIYDYHTWSSYMIIIYDHHISLSYMIIIHGHRSLLQSLEADLFKVFVLWHFKDYFLNICFICSAIIHG